MGYVWVLATVLLTVYGQLVFKWRIDEAGSIPPGTGAKVGYAVGLLLNPWVISVFAAALIASLAWGAALTTFELSFAYPFMSLSFAFVLLLSVVFFAEALTVAKLVGVALIMAGVVIGSQT